MAYNCEPYYCSRKPRRKSWKKVVHVECGHDPQDAIFEIDDGFVKEGQAFVLDRLVVDADDLYKPLVKLEFSSLIQFEGEDEETYEPEVEVDLLFKLERICHGKKSASAAGDISRNLMWKTLKKGKSGAGDRNQ